MLNTYNDGVELIIPCQETWNYFTVFKDIKPAVVEVFTVLICSIFYSEFLFQCYF